MGCAEFMWGNDDRDVARCRPSHVAAVVRPDGGGAATERITAGPTDESSTYYAVRVQGSGEDFVGTIDLTGRAGTIDLACTPTALVTLMTDEDESYRYVWALAVGEHALYPFLFFCTLDGRLDIIRYDGTDGTAPTYEYPSGRCQLDLTTQISQQVRLPGIDMPVPPPIRGYTIDGPSIHLPSGAEGTILLEGVEHRLLAFNTRDCGPDCPEPRWHELHSLIWLPQRQRMFYAVLRLDQAGDPVTVMYWVAFPGFRNGLARSEELPATFSTP
jgi:hypothetical protein